LLIFWKTQRNTSEGGRITVTTIKSVDHCVIEISDTGIGIPDKDIPHIWDRLYRVENSRSRNTGGAGIGLTICKKIISLHNGEITVSSKEGEGTTFQVKLPLY
jgi:two-component system sensor histidine kinase BaeS